MKVESCIGRIDNIDELTTDNQDIRTQLGYGRTDYPDNTCGVSDADHIAGGDVCYRWAGCSGAIPAA